MRGHYATGLATTCRIVGQRVLGFDLAREESAILNTNAADKAGSISATARQARAAFAEQQARHPKANRPA
jgi:predicted RNA methylase